jgi:hypothetical protein
MSTTDHVKEEIGLLKLFLGALIAIDVSLIAWLAQHYATADRFLVWAGVAATLALAASRFG